MEQNNNFQTSKVKIIMAFPALIQTALEEYDKKKKDFLDEPFRQKVVRRALINYENSRERILKRIHFRSFNALPSPQCLNNHRPLMLSLRRLLKNNSVTDYTM